MWYDGGELSEKRMELTPEQNRRIRAIMAELDCPKDFTCYKSKFDDLTPVEAFPGNSMVECRRVDPSTCPMAFTFGIGKGFCTCPLRKYVALELGK